MAKILVALALVTGIGVTTSAVAAHGPSQPALTGYTKDQCKNGGWQELGFKNQGQCVSSIVSNDPH